MILTVHYMALTASVSEDLAFDYKSSSLLRLHPLLLYLVHHYEPYYLQNQPRTSKSSRCVTSAIKSLLPLPALLLAHYPLSCITSLDVNVVYSGDCPYNLDLSGRGCLSYQSYPVPGVLHASASLLADTSSLIRP